MRKKGKGVITIFYAVLLPSVLFFLLGLFDLSRVAAAKNNIYMAANNGMDSALAEYDSNLLDKYGLFGYSSKNQVENVKNILLKNINPSVGNDVGDFYNLYGLNIDESNINVTIDKGLFQDDNMFATQMIKDMKFMALENLGTGIFDKLEKNEKLPEKILAAEKFEAINKKIGEIAKVLESIRQAEEALYLTIFSYGINMNNYGDKENGVFSYKDTKSIKELQHQEINFKNDSVNNMKVYTGELLQEDADNIYNEMLGNFIGNSIKYKYVDILLADHNKQAKIDGDKYTEKLEKYGKNLDEYNKYLTALEVYEVNLEIWEEYNESDEISNTPPIRPEKPQEVIEPKEVEKLADYKITELEEKGDFLELSNQNLDSFSNGLEIAKTKINKGIYDIQTNKSEIINIKNELEVLKVDISKLTGDDDFKANLGAQVNEYLDMLDVDRINLVEQKLVSVKLAIEYYNNTAKGAIKDRNDIVKADLLNLGYCVLDSGAGFESGDNKNKREKFYNLYKKTDDIESIANKIFGDHSINQGKVKSEIYNKLISNYEEKMKKPQIIEGTGSEQKFVFSISREINPVKQKEAEAIDNITSALNGMIDGIKDDESLVVILNEFKKNENDNVEKGELPSGEENLTVENLPASSVVGYKEPESFFAAGMDDLYIVEYVMSNFKSMVKDTEQMKRVPENPNKDTRLNYEVEAILFGKDAEYSGKESVDSIKNRLLLQRGGLNLVSFFSEKERFNIAKSIGTTASFGIPIIGIAVTALIITAWVAYESYLDVMDLLKGGTVPLIKLEGNWVSQFSFVDTKTKEPNKDKLLNIGKDDKKRTL